MTTGKTANAPIVRFFRAIVRDGQQEAFESFFLGTALPLLRSHDGMLSVTIGLPHEGSPNEFSMTTIWRDLQSLKGFSGEQWNEAVIHPDEAHLLRQAHVSHYYLADETPPGR